MKAAIDSGKTEEPVATFREGAPVNTTLRLAPDVMDVWTFHGENLKPWQGQRFALQVRSTWEKIAKGKPWGEFGGR